MPINLKFRDRHEMTIHYGDFLALWPVGDRKRGELDPTTKTSQPIVNCHAHNHYVVDMEEYLERS